jgi:hypothetical protein
MSKDQPALYEWTNSVTELETTVAQSKYQAQSVSSDRDDEVEDAEATFDGPSIPVEMARDDFCGTSRLPAVSRLNGSGNVLST